MHIHVGYFVLYTPIYRLTEWKTRFHVQNCPCRTVGAKIGYVLWLLVYGKAVVEFGWKVFLVDCLLWKTLNIVNITITERSGVLMHTKTPNVTIQGNITAMRYRNNAIRSVLLLHIRANLSMMLVRDYAACHAARGTLVMIVANMQTLRWPANSLYLNPIDHMLDLLKHKVRAQPL